MGRPRNPERKEQIIREYQRQINQSGRVSYPAITRAVGLYSNHGSYAQRVVQKWREAQEAKGQRRECLCCDSQFISTGRHHRLCDRCRFDGEYERPCTVSPAVHFAGVGRY